MIMSQIVLSRDKKNEIVILLDFCRIFEISSEFVDAVYPF